MPKKNDIIVTYLNNQECFLHHSGVIFIPKIKAKKQKDFSEGLPDPVATMAGGVQSKAGKLPELPDIVFLNEGSSFH